MGSIAEVNNKSNHLYQFSWNWLNLSNKQQDAIAKNILLVGKSLFSWIRQMTGRFDKDAWPRGSRRKRHETLKMYTIEKFLETEMHWTEQNFYWCAWEIYLASRERRQTVPLSYESSIANHHIRSSPLPTHARIICSWLVRQIDLDHNVLSRNVLLARCNLSSSTTNLASTE